MKKIILTTLMAAMAATAVTAQQVKMCGTDENLRDMLQQNPEQQEERMQFDARLKDFMKTYNKEEFRASKSLGKNSAPKYIIPVVVHILHANGSENISDAQVQSEIDFLNKSFRKLNSDTGRVRPIFKDIAEDAQIEFRLARKDPNGNCTNGIVRVFTTQTTRGNDNLKKISVWDTKRYFNMWVVRTINRGPGVAVAGYAQFPFFAGGAFSASTDGIMVIHNEFGNVGTSNPGQTPNVTTSTHESGHWLGLYHPFQGDSCDNEGDGVQETPTTYKWQDGLRACCPATICTQTPCSGTNLVSVRQPNTCSSDNPDLPDMIENFMDYYIGDSASNMFTTQQVARMHFVLENYRRELWQPENLVKTGTDVPNAPATCAPLPAFSTTTGNFTVCPGGTLELRDNSYNGAVTTRTWNFGEGATPQTSTTTVQTVTWATAGWKNITLTVTNANGTTTKTFAKAVYVEPNNSSNITGGVSYADWDYVNDFLKKGWHFENETDGAQWVRNTQAAYSGGISMVLLRNSLNYGSAYSLVSPTFNLAGASNPYLSFYLSFAQAYTGPTASSEDGLDIYVSTDCGKTWVNRRSLSGSTLSSNLSPLYSNTNYVPININQWRKEEIKGSQIGTGAALNNVKFKITFTYQGGHNLYLDNLQVGVNSSVDEILKPSDINFSVYPNPFTQTAQVDFETDRKEQVTITLSDITGKQISTLVNETKDAGKHQLTIDKAALGLSNGMYFINVKVGNSGFTQKVVLQ